jgi:hypothetical protein
MTEPTTPPDPDDPGIRLTTPREILAARLAFSSFYRSCSVVQRAILYAIFQDVGRSDAGAMTTRPVELRTICERARLAPEIVTPCLEQLEGPLLERSPDQWRLWVANSDGQVLSEDEGMVVAAVWQMRAELYPLERLIFARTFSRRPPPDARTIATELAIENVALVEQLHADLMARLDDLFADLTGQPIAEVEGDRIARASRALAVRFLRRPSWSREPPPEGWSIAAEREGMRVYGSGDRSRRSVSCRARAVSSGSFTFSTPTRSTSTCCSARASRSLAPARRWPSRGAWRSSRSLGGGMWGSGRASAQDSFPCARWTGRRSRNGRPPVTSLRP